MSKLVMRRGCPEGVIDVSNRLHEHAEYRVRVHGGKSAKWKPKRSLREGCPSSPWLSMFITMEYCRTSKNGGKEGGGAGDDAGSTMDILRGWKICKASKSGKKDPEGE